MLYADHYINQQFEKKSYFSNVIWKQPRAGSSLSWRRFFVNFKFGTVVKM